MPTNWTKSGYLPVGKYIRAPIDPDGVVVLKPGVDFREPKEKAEQASFGHSPVKVKTK